MKRALLEAAVLLSIAHGLTKCAPYAWWSRLLGTARDVPHDAEGSGANACGDIQTVVTAVRMAARGLPWKVVCLPEAMAVKWMLLRRGCVSTLCLGVGKGSTAASGTNEFHAWLLVGDASVIGGDEPGRYQCFARFV